MTTSCVPRRSSLLLVGLVCAFLMGFTGCKEEYSEVMQQKIKTLLGEDFKDYTWSSYPTDNFGIVTSYDPAKGDSFGDMNFLCATWSCLSMQVPTDPDKKLNIAGFADVGNNGGIIKLSEKETTDLATSVVLPEIYEIVKVSADAGANTDVKTQMTLGRVYPRKLIRSKMLAYVKTLQSDDPMKAAFERGNLTLIVADVVIDSMLVKIQVDKTKQAKLAVDLASKLEVGKIFKGAKLELKVNRADNGEFEFEVVKPVILAVLARKQPQAGVLEAPGTGWDDWKVVPVPHNEVLKKNQG